MVIALKKFGEFLISRPAGREAYLAAKAYSFPQKKEAIVVDFDGVKGITPSWADEFLTPLQRDFPGKVSFVNTENPSVKATLEILSDTK